MKLDLLRLALAVVPLVVLLGGAAGGTLFLSRRSGRTLPVRAWLGIGVLTIFLVPALTVESIAVFAGRGEVVNDAKALETVERDVRGNVGRWADPAWQAELRQEGARVGVDVDLLDGSGVVILRTNPDPLTPRPEEGDAAATTRVVRTLLMDDGAGGSAAAHLYSYPIVAKAGASSFGRAVLTWLPLIGLGVLAITIAGVAWSVGPIILRPLAAMSDVARAIAAGRLDAAPPASHVREVAEVSTAFTAMGEALRESLERQAELEQERRLFITAIAHDLRTPLFSLRGYLEGLETGVAATPERTARYLRVCREKAGELERLIADLFAFSRLEYLEQEPQREPLEFGALARRAMDGMQPQAEAKAVALVIDPPEAGSAWLEGDPHLLTRVLTNLLDNALRVTPPGGRVTLRWRGVGERLVFAVSDTGPGIAPHDLPHLFDPLYRADASRNRQTGGAGFGLTIARRILRAHGGDLSAANGAAGGAVLTGVLPAATPTDTAPQQAGAGAHRHAWTATL